jgi:CelD/BcsL family acetyltransferase involved in cellulose biosynthesis
MHLAANRDHTEVCQDADIPGADAPLAAGCRARWVFLSDLTEIDRTCWLDLAGRADDANAFLLPDFAVAAWRHLPTNRNDCLAIVEDVRTRRWLAAGVVRNEPASWRFPLPLLVGARSPHSYRSGLLLDAESAATALDTLLTLFSRAETGVHGLVFDGLRLDSQLVVELASAAERHGMSWRTSVELRSPAVRPELLSDEYLKQHWSRSRRKTLRQSRARLEKLGTVELRLISSPAEIPDAVSTFLMLESAGWKGVAGTACGSSQSTQRFIEEMVVGLSLTGNVLITELHAGDHLIASAINLVHRDELFAFKIGWDPQYASYGPGVLHEVELLQQARDRLRNCKLFDSCSRDGTYIARLWPERISVGTGRLTWGTSSALATRLTDSLRAAMRFVRG